MRGIRQGLGRRVGLPRWSLWAFLAVSASIIVVTAARNWTEVNTTTPQDPEGPPAVPELVAPPDGAVIVPPVTLKWAMPLGPGPVEVRVLGPDGTRVLVRTCLSDSLPLDSRVTTDPGRYRWQVVPRGLAPRSVPSWDFVLRNASAQAP
jgi:hypothetical protein